MDTVQHTVPREWLLGIKSTHKPFVIMGQKTLLVVEHPLQQACHLRNLSNVIKLPLCNATSLLAKTITTISYPGCNFKDV